MVQPSPKFLHFHYIILKLFYFEKTIHKEQRRRRILRIKSIQYIISLVAIILIIVHLAIPSLLIDGVTLALIIIAIVPWLAPLFKSLELPGGWKIEFQELLDIKDNAEKAGLLVPSSEIELSSEYSFQVIAENDPNLALAGLRIEIEKRLQNIAKSRNIWSRYLGIRGLIDKLNDEGVLDKQETVVLRDIIVLLNSAVHGADVDKRAFEWIMDVGPRLLKSLDVRL